MLVVLSCTKALNERAQRSNADSALCVDWNGLHKSCNNNLLTSMDTGELFVEFVVRTIHQNLPLGKLLMDSY